jgi:uncharacterized protein (TIGR02217 family)
MGGSNEQRVVLQPDSMRQYEAAHSTITLAQARSVYKFFNGRRAQTHSFKLRDKLLYQVTAEPFGTGGGVASTNQLIINEGDAANAYNREIYLPESGTVQIRAGVTLKTEGVDYTLAYNGANGGLVTWLTSVSGQALTWTGNFYVPVRFDVSSLPDIEMIQYRSNNTGAATGPVIPMVEVDYPGEWV